MRSHCLRLRPDVRFSALVTTIYIHAPISCAGSALTFPRSTISIRGMGSPYPYRTGLIFSRTGGVLSIEIAKSRSSVVLQRGSALLSRSISGAVRLRNSQKDLLKAPPHPERRSPSGLLVCHERIASGSVCKMVGSSRSKTVSSGRPDLERDWFHRAPSWSTGRASTMIRANQAILNVFLQTPSSARIYADGPQT